MLLTLLLLSFVALAVAVGAALVVSRAAAGHELEDELHQAAERERAARLLVDDRPDLPVAA